MCCRPQLNDCISLLLETRPLTDIDIPEGGSQLVFRPRKLQTIEHLIQCPKKLRVMLGERNNKVIKMELENTFNILGEDQD